MRWLTSVLILIAFPFFASVSALSTGYLLKMIFPLDLFQSTLILILCVFTVIVAVGMMFINDSIKGYFFLNEEIDFKETENDNNVHALPIIRSKPKVRRNQTCVCGSGKKFKVCCMNSSIDAVRT